MAVDTSEVTSYRAAVPSDSGTSTAKTPSSTPTTVAGVIEQVANQLGVDPIAAEADAYHESGLNPKSVGDGGTSFGLYQLHEGGELDNLPGNRQQQIAEAYDPATNAHQALSEVASVRAAEPTASWGQVFADAERPANKPAYADSINSLIAQAANGKAPWTTAGAVSASDTDNGTTNTADSSGTSTGDSAEEAAYISTFKTQDASWSLNPLQDAGQALGDVVGPVFSASSNAIVKAFGPLFTPVSEVFHILRNMLNVVEWLFIPTNDLRVIIFIVGMFVLAYGAKTAIAA